ncbi:hypothetical protein ACQR1I_28165 [Bradyrhizobium sp. HKCCYLS2038]|uniref:hypothetical protein n=1 Tax=unclassified Bradyrhizobium TaxID=2631580 RepID=UPI003EB8374C
MSEAPDSVSETRPVRLREALRQARIEAADRTGVVVDLRDAEVARLEILNDALDALFNEIPGQIDLFDRGISQGETPRLWIDVVAHVVMGRDKRQYRFVQDTRNGRIVLAESHDISAIVKAVTDYVARRMVERERAFSVTHMQALPADDKPRQRSRVWPFVLGFVLGALSLFAVAVYESLKPITF